jgi:post-segregation antitoxin (ccd killing protein)
MAKSRLGRDAFGERENPLSDLTKKKPASQVVARKSEKRSEPREPREEGTRGPLTVSIRKNLLEKARDAVYWSHGLTLAGLIESALSAELEKLEKKRGEPFQTRKGELSSGRPIR